MMLERPKYCTACGRKLKVKRKIYSGGYDSQTGKKNREVGITIYSCPRAGGLSFDSHTYISYDDGAIFGAEYTI